MRYFVTGATGFIGGHVARELREAGHEVVAVVRDPARATKLAAIGVDVRKGDITDKESLRGPMAGVDGLFHLAGWYEIGRKHREMCRRVNVDGTRNVLVVMRELGIPRGVYTSSVAVFGDTHGKMVDESYRHNGPWLTEYDHTKWAAHYEVAEPMMRKGLPLVIVQPGVVYGPGDPSRLGDALRQYLKRELRGVPRTAEYSWGHVDDIARAHILAMKKGRVGESYIVAGERQTLVAALDLAERITGIPPPKLRPSAGFLRTVGAITRSEVLRAAPATYLGDNAKAKRELGLTHRSLSEGLVETLGYEMERLGIPAPMPLA